MPVKVGSGATALAHEPTIDRSPTGGLIRQKGVWTIAGLPDRLAGYDRERTPIVLIGWCDRIGAEGFELAIGTGQDQGWALPIAEPLLGVPTQRLYRAFGTSSAGWGEPFLACALLPHVDSRSHSLVLEQ
jgi:hypothetical protein